MQRSNLWTGLLVAGLLCLALAVIAESHFVFAVGLLVLFVVVLLLVFDAIDFF